MIWICNYTSNGSLFESMYQSFHFTDFFYVMQMYKLERNFLFKYGSLEHGILTFCNFSLFHIEPIVESGSFNALHGRALIQMLREMWLVETCGIYHFSLGDVMLLHIQLDHLRYLPWILSVLMETNKWRETEVETWFSESCHIRP